MLIKVHSASNNYVHLWNYEAFKEKHNAKTKSWDINGNLINSIIYDVQGDIDMEFTKSLGLKCDYIT